MERKVTLLIKIICFCGYRKVDNQLNKEAAEAYWKIIWDNFVNGETAALDVIYNSHVDLLYSYGTKICANTGLVEDAIQDLFLYLLSKRGKLASPNFIRLYLLKSFKRILFEKMIKERQYLNNSEQHKFKFDLILEESEVLEKNLKEKKLEMIEGLIKNLDTGKREVLFLKFYSGLSYDEIGEIAGIKPDSAKKIVYRIITSFREIIKDKVIELLFIFFKRKTAIE